MSRLSWIVVALSALWPAAMIWSELRPLPPAPIGTHPPSYIIEPRGGFAQCPAGQEWNEACVTDPRTLPAMPLSVRAMLDQQQHIEQVFDTP